MDTCPSVPRRHRDHCCGLKKKTPLPCVHTSDIPRDQDHIRGPNNTARNLFLRDKVERACFLSSWDTQGAKHRDEQLGQRYRPSRKPLTRWHVASEKSLEHQTLRSNTWRGTGQSPDEAVPAEPQAQRPRPLFSFSPAEAHSLCVIVVGATAASPVGPPNSKVRQRSL